MSWTTPDGSPDAVVDALEKRAGLLRRLADGPRRKPALQADLGVSRSTVYKALRELEELGLVRRTDDGYALTQFGRLARRTHDEFRATIHRLCEVGGFLPAVPGAELLPVAFVRRGRVVCVTRHAPERPLRAFGKRAAASSRLRVLSPVAMPRYVPALRERVVEREDLTVDLVLEAGALSYLVESSDRFEDLVAADGFTLHRTERAVPYGLTVFDECAAALAAYDDGGGPRGLLLSSAPPAVAWSERVFDRHREAAEPVTG